MRVSICYRLVVVVMVGGVCDAGERWRILRPAFAEAHRDGGGGRIGPQPALPCGRSG